MPIIVFFFQEFGLTMHEIFILQAIFALSNTVFEIPSGYFADLAGRRMSMIFGIVFTTIGYLVLSVSSSFYEFALGEFILAIGVSFISGADSALIYDSLLAAKEEMHYKKIEGRMLSLSGISEGLAGLAGGFLAAINLRYPFYASVLLMLIALPIAISIIEPPRKRLKDNLGNIKVMKKILSFTFIENLKLRYLMCLFASVNTAALCAAWLVQPYLLSLNAPLTWYGPVWAALNLSLGVMSLVAYKIESKLGKWMTGSLLVSLVFLSYMFLSISDSILGLLGFFILYFCRSLSTPVFKDYVNTLTTSDIRATVLSIKTLSMRLSFVIVGPIIGFLIDNYSLSISFTFCGILFAISGIVSLSLLRKAYLAA